METSLILPVIVILIALIGALYYLFIGAIKLLSIANSFPFIRFSLYTIGFVAISITIFYITGAIFTGQLNKPL